ncbi:hypothetical protein KP509_1Z249000 [Ceratopteris richardii]|nr:hypothetical protein KP509_1Z249000 [Ceratopteris richardii]
MSTNYNVFICHRGPDTKHNIVSVSEGMLRSNGITCFVDYRMDEGNDVNVSIRNAIDISLVHIVILSPTFNTSSWCLDEALRIIEIQKTSMKVLPVFCDVAPYMVRHQSECSTYDLQNMKGSTDEERKRWAKALYDLSNLKGFEYSSKTM